MTQSVAIVTGAAGDIGAAIAARLADDHDIVLLADIDREAAAAVAATLCPQNRFVAVGCDVTSEESVSHLASRCAELGQLQTLVNNAGAARAVSLHDTTPSIWRMDNALNLEAAFLCFRAVEDMLKASKGSVINIASVNGMNVFGHPAYSAAKAGLIHFTRLVAVEYGKFGIRSNAVAPGTVRTRAWEARAAANPNVFEEARRWYPLQRVVDPKDVANAVAFLAGSQAAAISGVCLPVDCGLTAGQAELARTFSQSDHY
ncbi:SDR family oxidoreductase [Rhizobium sp. SEMIA 4085]|uniref:Short-chain dehydrogenase/reductase SDR family protein n=1 Tax=Rhizobium gallicum bv. gallicum R602sp TaxID=1041138 RepID=A0A0B4XF74_9HYPH|nr:MULTISPECIES: SDR family oxidoreductase [Rhizobium]AJD45741.1 short-chain dehydrogenase/reductase SDR family protein [Rhizobium gallicum bv. gallicum R602sp]NNH29773.1 SDR family oxidoreductase [Rhizobium sp. SEMIA 4085]TDW20923.1 NAD(P)-dependent dehydrogenase (short-subunit alcohol dehydrogenase family) [Rhizobium azibense]